MRTPLCILTRSRLCTGPGFPTALRGRVGRALARAGFRGVAHTLAVVAVDEAAANVWEHGYDMAEGEPVAVWVLDDGPGRVRVGLLDRAPRPYPADRAPADLERLAAERAPRGRGIALMQRVAETVEHRPRRGGGNALWITLDRERIEQETRREAA